MCRCRLGKSLKLRSLAAKSLFLQSSFHPSKDHFTSTHITWVDGAYQMKATLFSTRPTSCGNQEEQVASLIHYTTLPIPFLINLYPLYVAVPRSTFSHAEYLIPFRDTMIKQNYTALVRQQTDLHETQTNRPVDIKRKLISNRKNCKATRGWDQQLHCV